jgi:glycosyltransferase involved in cell wall biosynthesis
LKLAIDATYSTGRNLTGVGIYSRELLWGLALAHPEVDFRFCYRSHRYFAGRREQFPANVKIRLLNDAPFLPGFDFLHGLNQRLPRRRSKHFVTTFHDLFVLTADYSTPEFKARFAEQARDAAERSDLIICVSQFTANQVHELLQVERSKLRVVHHGIRFPAANQEPLSMNREEKVILFVGALQKRKNLTRLIKAFEQVGPEWRLVLAGSHGFGASEIVDMAANSPRSADISLPGYITDEQLENYYANCDIFAFPSLDEGFGIPVLEAMAWGIPVLTGNRSALPEVTGDAALHVDPEDTEELTFALKTLTEQEGLRRKLSEMGMARAAEFSWEAAVDQTWAVYKELF